MVIWDFSKRKYFDGLRSIFFSYRGDPLSRGLGVQKREQKVTKFVSPGEKWRIMYRVYTSHFKARGLWNVQKASLDEYQSFCLIPRTYYFVGCWGVKRVWILQSCETIWRNITHSRDQTHHVSSLSTGLKDSVRNWETGTNTNIFPAL